MDIGAWDWGWSLKQFDINRNELSSQPNRHVGFANHVPTARAFGRKDGDIRFKTRNAE